MPMDAEAAAARLSSAGLAAGRFRPLLRLSLNAHGLLLSLALAYLAGFLLLSAMEPAVAAKSGLEVGIGILTFSLPAALFALAGYKFGELALFERPDRPILALWRNLRAVLTSPTHMANGLPMVMGLVVFMYAFTMTKGSISAVVPFSWDETFDRWDVALHFGYRPWQLLQPVLGYWPITFLLNFNYNFWFVVMNLFWVYYAFIAKPGVARTRFFLAFTLTWMVGGSLLAIFFSSAGPCYFTRLALSPDPYQPLMAYLNDANAHATIWALGTQDLLWNYLLDGSALGGISAMPSMHNATTLLFVAAAGSFPRWVRMALWAHLVLIFLGSIHLGWHYAVDCYLGWAIAYGVWRAVGPVARWWEETHPARTFADVLNRET
jgi:hypothetical protein